MAKPFNGKHMAGILVAGFGVVICVNFAMAALASSTFGGLVVENSYVASQNFNGWLEKSKESEALGWNVELARQSDGHVTVIAAGAPADVTASGDAWHPLGRLPDRPLRFRPAGTGRFVSTEPLPAGRWLVRLELANGAEVWRGERALP